ncbi:uncharacterized protein LOC106657491 isoform X1 [Trichogramma pretiosum]|uniref:uncharacterized protein LOC106657491 isoform X1 n=2 Tax=Trichogramma pretiosum TaxID=7493 RepID=UPI0006C98AEB|nr:uncharacterized protein LOC106657491 isoform X1 [Trichogramma pretiosum]
MQICNMQLGIQHLAIETATRTTMPQTEKPNTSFLEEDLALSSSCTESFAEKATTESEDKSSHDESNSSISENHDQPPVIYLNENAMDCNYELKAEEPQNSSLIKSQEQKINILKLINTSVMEEAPSSPDLFESDDEEIESIASTFTRTAIEDLITQPSPEKLTTAEKVLRSDRFALKRMKKFLSGVPPPPSRTISQKDCNDFLGYIKQNRHCFWADPFKLDSKFNPVTEESELNESKNESIKSVENENSVKSENLNPNTSETSNPIESGNTRTSQRPGLRNLSTAFDACEKMGKLKTTRSSSGSTSDLSQAINAFNLSDSLLNQSYSSISTTTPNMSYQNDDIEKGAIPATYHSISVEEAIKMSWPDILQHKCPELYYNRSRTTEDFENLRFKMSDRYIGAETTSTCNIYFPSEVPNSAKKRAYLLAKKRQSPGKRLSHLAIRRFTFSSANLQSMSTKHVEKKLMVNMSKFKPRKTGRTPKKIPGKSPRKTPRSSAKKTLYRRMTFDTFSPRAKLESSKRALFQSPPQTKDNSSNNTRAERPTSMVSLNNNDPRKIKKALFATPTKKNVNELSQNESRKRKREEDEEIQRSKHPRSYSFDCSRTLENSSLSSNRVRHSSGNVPQKAHYRNEMELAEINRKKLIYAVTEALKAHSIPVGHERFKECANALRVIVRKYMPDLDNKNIPRKPGSTMERMLRLAKRHAVSVLNPKPSA